MISCLIDVLREQTRRLLPAACENEGFIGIQIAPDVLVALYEARAHCLRTFTLKAHSLHYSLLAGSMTFVWRVMERYMNAVLGATDQKW